MPKPIYECYKCAKKLDSLCSSCPDCGQRLQHNQVSLGTTVRPIFVDEGIKDIIYACWILGIKTRYSCQGGLAHSAKAYYNENDELVKMRIWSTPNKRIPAYIMFDDVESSLAFQSLINHIKGKFDWYFSPGEENRVRDTCSVHFNKKLLPKVLTALNQGW